VGAPLLGAIIGLVVWAIVRLTRRGDSPRDTGERSALDIARERYARGEITRDEFQQIKKDLAQR
jgi:putative membrane protein